MKIQEAILEARENQEVKGGFNTIRRAGADDGNFVAINKSDTRPVTKYRRGQPGFSLTPEDLLADDWEVCVVTVLS